MRLEREVGQRLVLASPPRVAGVQHGDARLHEHLVEARHVRRADAEARQADVEIREVERPDRVQVVHLGDRQPLVAQEIGQHGIPGVRLDRLPAQQHVQRVGHDAHTYHRRCGTNLPNDHAHAHTFQPRTIAESTPRRERESAGVTRG